MKFMKSQVLPIDIYCP